MAVCYPKGQVGAEVQPIRGTKPQTLALGCSCSELAPFTNSQEVSHRLICMGVDEAETWGRSCSGRCGKGME